LNYLVLLRTSFLQNLPQVSVIAQQLIIFLTLTGCIDSPVKTGSPLLTRFIYSLPHDSTYTRTLPSLSPCLPPPSFPPILIQQTPPNISSPHSSLSSAITPILLKPHHRKRLIAQRALMSPHPPFLLLLTPKNKRLDFGPPTPIHDSTSQNS
jgi:hypothetical protein